MNPNNFSVSTEDRMSRRACEIKRASGRYKWASMLFTALSFVALLMAAGCRTEGTSATGPAPVNLRMSIIPTTDPGKIVRESQPLVAYLEEETGANIALTVPTNYAAVVEAVVNDQVDIVYLGGFTYVQASARAGVTPLVQRERDRNFHSVFITQPDSGINSLADLKGRTFAFGDVNSTSGHLMPSYFMRQENVLPDAMTKVTYTGGHDATALAVANRKVDAGALDEAVFERMTKEGKLDSRHVKIFYVTPPYFDYVWAARKGLDRNLADSFVAAMMKLSPDDPAHKSLLDLLSADKIVKAEDGNYDRLRQAAKDAGLIK